MLSMDLARNKVGTGEIISGSDIGRPQGPTMPRSTILLTLKTKVAGSLLESKWVKSNKTTDRVQTVCISCR